MRRGLERLRLLVAQADQHKDQDEGGQDEEQRPGLEGLLPPTLRAAGMES